MKLFSTFNEDLGCADMWWVLDEVGGWIKGWVGATYVTSLRITDRMI